MPRKPKLPPIGNMVIEGLSDGREIRAASVVDDFTGQPIAVAQDMRPARRLKTGAELRAELQQIERERKQHEGAEVLRKAKVRGFTDPVELIPRGKRKVGEIDGKAVLIAMPAWRRV